MDALITGANRGIGAEMRAQMIARGDTVIGTTRAAPPDETWRSYDALTQGDAGKLADGIDGPLDLLVCNAGIYPDKGQSLNGGYPREMWDDGFAVNVTAVFEVIRAFLPRLQASSGKIAIISSQMASDTRAPGGSYIYRASKAAVLNLGRNLAVDFKEHGIAVGIYHPGWVQTDMGGSLAPVTPAQSAAGLLARFDALSLASTGCFETYDGQAHPF